MPGPSVSVTTGPPNQAYTSINDYSGTSLIYSGLAKSGQQKSALTVTSFSKANPGVVTVTAHGLDTDNVVTISGATGDWAALNGDQLITRTGANTFTVAVNTAGYAGTFDGTIITMAPQTSKACWAIQKFYYDGSGNLLRAAWANSMSTETQIWDSRTSLAFA